MDDYIKEFGDAIYRDRVRRARLQSPEEKMRDGPRLFDIECSAINAAIRRRFPDATDEWVREVLKEYVALQESADGI